MSFDPIKTYEMEAEQGFLGILLVNNQSYDEIIGIVESTDFLYPVHAEIFKKIGEFMAAGKSVSPVTMRPWFDSHVDLHEVGGSAYLADLAGSIVSFLNVISYARTIRMAAEKRRFIEVLQEMQVKIATTADSEPLRIELLEKLEKSTTNSIFAKSKTDVIGEILAGFKLPSACDSVGIEGLDYAMGGGLFAGFTYGIAGAEKSGKTTTAQTISYNLNASGVRHAYVALEMGSRQIEQRNLARAMGINSLAFLEVNKEKMAEKVAKIAVETPDNTTYLDMAGCNFDQIKSEIMKLVKNGGIKGFILDYWQLVQGCDPRQNKSEFLFEIVQWIAAYCRRHGVWSIVLSQLNRDGRLLGSAGLERACDQLYVLGESKCAYGEGIFIKLTHSRYTPTCQLGAEDNPRFEINKRCGPFLQEIL